MTILNLSIPIAEFGKVLVKDFAGPTGNRFVTLPETKPIASSVSRVISNSLQSFERFCAYFIPDLRNAITAARSELSPANINNLKILPA